MTNQSLKYAHPLDLRLADETLFSWFGPMFQLFGSHWPVALAAGVASVVVRYLIGLLPWFAYIAYAPWWKVAIYGLVETVALTVVGVLAYRAIAHREGLRYRVGEVNASGSAALRGVQIAVVWIVLALLVELALVILSKLLVGMFSGSNPSSTTVVLLIVAAIYGVPILIFLLAPIWVALGVSSALSQAHAARSLEGSIAAVFTSLRLVFSQKWRVAAPAYCFGALAGLIMYLQIKYSFLPAALMNPWLLNVLAIVMFGLGVTMTFVIERVYSPDLGIEPGAEPAPVSESAPAASPTPGGGTVGAAAPTASASATPAPSAAHAPAIAELVENELRINKTTELVDLTERGLAADPRFFAEHTESIVTLAKRMVQAQRPDLALRVLQPYVKEQRKHRLHLTGSLLAAELLSRDPAQLQSAARFLAQLKTYYPDEPMVDRMTRLTDKAIAAANAPPKSPGA